MTHDVNTIEKKKLWPPRKDLRFRDQDFQDEYADKSWPPPVHIK